jgi:hypothetical protein
MPNVDDQITPDNFRAPEGKFRIIREEMSDGKLSIVADFNIHEFSVVGLEASRAAHPEDVFTLCDENGPLDN